MPRARDRTVGRRRTTGATPARTWRFASGAAPPQAPRRSGPMQARRREMRPVSIAPPDDTRHVLAARASALAGAPMPEHAAEHDQTQPPGRLYLCGRCRAQLFICRHCDRGNHYCRGCAGQARRESVRAAGQRYQASRRGRFMHAARTQRWRARRQEVTHQGSPRASQVMYCSRPPAAAVCAAAGAAAPRCHCCGVPLPRLVRTDFSRRRGTRCVRRFDRGNP